MIFGAVLAIAGNAAYQRVTVDAQQTALRELIRFELAQNARSLTTSSANLREADSDLERFLSGDSPAPSLAAGYLGLATVGLRTQLEDPSVFHADYRILALYSFVYGRLVRLAEVQRTLDAAAVQYRAALNLEDRRRAAAHLLAVIRYQLNISDALTSDRGLPVLLQCMDQFSAGQDECEYAPGAVEQADVLGDDVAANSETDTLSVEHEDSSDQANRGIAYFLGRGVPQDYREAAKRFRLAAHRGNATAQNNLGAMYATGRGVPQDYEEAARWYRLAADQGSATAQNSLGSVYATGRGVAHDDEEAARLFGLAAAQGNANAQNNLGIMYDTGRGVQQDHEEAVKWFRLAADQGDANAQSNLGLMHAHGRGVQRNYEEGARWLRRAADQGHSEAQSNLGVLYATGRGVQQDYEEAVRWYRLAADQGDAAAQNNLGGMYAHGRGVQQDYEEAVRWFRRAADQGDARAQNNLGILYSEGQGVTTDYVSAHKWLNLAATQGHEDARRLRDTIAARMSTEEILEAQRAARDTLRMGQ